MSRFSDPYLAESVGYGTGHARGVGDGIHIGREQGYSNGWNDAMDRANSAIAEWKQCLQESKARNATLASANERLTREVQRLRESLREAEDAAAQSHADHAHVSMLFLGAVAIAGPALKAVAKLPFEDRYAVFDRYCIDAFRLQGDDYIKTNRLPHFQPLMREHLPLASKLFHQAFDENEARKAQAKQEAEAEAA